MAIYEYETKRDLDIAPTEFTTLLKTASFENISGLVASWAGASAPSNSPLHELTALPDPFAGEEGFSVPISRIPNRIAPYSCSPMHSQSYHRLVTAKAQEQ